LPSTEEIRSLEEDGDAGRDQVFEVNRKRYGQCFVEQRERLQVTGNVRE
jgi:hypothetical protein